MKPTERLSTAWYFKLPTTVSDCTFPPSFARNGPAASAVSFHCNRLLPQPFFINWCGETEIMCVWRSSQPQDTLSGTPLPVGHSCRAALQRDNQLIKVLSMNSTALRRDLGTRREFHHLKATSWDKQGDLVHSNAFLYWPLKADCQYLLLIFDKITCLFDWKNVNARENTKENVIICYVYLCV